MSSGVRLTSPPQEQVNVISSTNGLGRSSGSRIPFPSRNSAMLPTHFREEQWEQIQTGSGVPQNRSRESDQSLFSSSQFPNRPSPTSGGCHPIVLFSSTMRAAYFVVAMYHDSRA